MKCLQENGDCQGLVEMRSLDGVKWWPRCEYHWAKRLDSYDNSIERYAHSSVAPDWFDPSYAGESWDDD